MCAADPKAVCVIIVLSIISRNQAQSYHNTDTAWSVLTHTYISRNRKGTESASFRLSMGIHLSSQQYYIIDCVCVFVCAHMCERLIETEWVKETFKTWTCTKAEYMWWPLFFTLTLNSLTLRQAQRVLGVLSFLFSVPTSQTSRAWSLPNLETQTEKKKKNRVEGRKQWLEQEETETDTPVSWEGERVESYVRSCRSETNPLCLSNSLFVIDACQKSPFFASYFVEVLVKLIWQFDQNVFLFFFLCKSCSLPHSSVPHFTSQALAFHLSRLFFVLVLSLLHNFLTPPPLPKRPFVCFYFVMRQSLF